MAHLRGTSGENRVLERVRRGFNVVSSGNETFSVFLKYLIVIKSDRVKCSHHIISHVVCLIRFVDNLFAEILGEEERVPLACLRN